jgi:hypothetical protein
VSGQADMQPYFPFALPHALRNTFGSVVERWIHPLPFQFKKTVVWSYTMLRADCK